MVKKTLPLLIILFGVIGLMSWGKASSLVTTENKRTFIIDQRGERWDITQAVSIGFKPEGFQYGIGRDAFTPLDESGLSDDTPSVSRSLRVIGIADGDLAQAYSVDKLRRHEIANSILGSKPIAAGY